MKNVNPCINCLTYSICKDEYLHELQIQMSMTHQFNTKIDIMSQVEYSAYYQSIGKKCSLIRQYISNHERLKDTFLETLTSDELREVFKIDPTELTFYTYKGTII